VSAIAHPQPSSPRRAFCAAVSSASEESLAATASRIDNWILIEYRGPWRRDVLGGSLLSPELKTHLREQLAALRPARLLFVKQPERRSDDGRRVFLVSSTPGSERLLSLEVSHQDELRGFDVAGALRGEATVAEPAKGPLFVVCTHGKRDRCCARHGRPLYDALRAEAESGTVWQSTHVGGDRFAGNVVALPHGLYYGRVEPPDVGQLLAAHRAGDVDLARYRGRCAYPFAVQAAEQAIRESEGLLGVDDLQLVGARRHGDDAWRIRFRAPGGAVHRVDVDAVHADEPAYLTCDAEEPRHARRHVVTAHRVLSR
jgi:hypothetical protein